MIIEGYLNPYEADAWVIIQYQDSYRILAGFNATDKMRSSYRASEKLVDVRDTDDGARLVFLSRINSKYICRQEQYGLSVSTERAYSTYFSDWEILDEDTDWFGLNFSAS